MKKSFQSPAGKQGRKQRMRRSKARKSGTAHSVSDLIDPSPIIASPASRQSTLPDANSDTNQQFVQTPQDNFSNNQPFNWAEFMELQSPSTSLAANPFVGAGSTSAMDLSAEFQGCQLTPAAMACLQQLEKLERQAQRQPSVASAAP